MAKDLIKVADSKLILLTNNAAKFALIITSKESQFNCGEIVKDIALPLGGKGGGSKVSAQVTFGITKELSAFIDSILELNKF